MTNKLSFFAGKASFLGIGYYLLFSYNNQNAWACILMGSLLGIGVIYLVSKLQSLLKCDFIRKYKCLYTTYRIIFSIFYSYIILIFLTLLPLFVNSFYLVSTPTILIVAPFFLTAVYIAYKGKDVLCKLSNILFIFSIFLIILTMLVLFKYFEINHFLPFLNSSKMNLLKGTIIYTSISSIPFLITMEYENNLNKNLKIYILLSTILFFICVFIVGTLGPVLVSIYSFPEYIVLKRISILGFIENVENILSFIWYFDLIIILGVSSLNLKNTINNKCIYIIILITLLLISVYFFGYNYEYIIIFFVSYPYILILFFIIFMILLIILHYKKTKRIKST